MTSRKSRKVENIFNFDSVKMPIFCNMTFWQSPFLSLSPSLRNSSYGQNCQKIFADRNDKKTKTHKFWDQNICRNKYNDALYEKDIGQGHGAL